LTIKQNHWGGEVIRLFICALLILTPVSAVAQDTSTIEQAIEGLRTQLRDVTEKEAALQARVRQLEEELKPENIERSVAGIGTTDARALRDERRQQLEREKANVESQLTSLAASRNRLETSIASAEAEAVRIRANALGANNASPQTDTPSAALPTAENKTVKKSSNKRPARKRTRRVRPRRRATSH
jgi:septal ring factor EnvC (AmiA/AmiB activator)